jgi:hypothetical protein
MGLVAKLALPENLRDRVVEMRRVRSGDLRPHPLNWRVHPEHQSRALGVLLRELGIAGALLSYQAPDGALVLIDGHLRQGGDPETVWPVIVTDLSEEEARLLLATYDPLAGLATRDDAVMAELLALTDQDVLAELLRENDPLADLLGQTQTEEAIPPSEFTEYDETIDTEHKCPRCGYEWSGQSA